MKIKVLYSDTSVGYVDAGSLEALIASKTIAAFFRSGEWVNVSNGLVRRGTSSNYVGPERRAAVHVEYKFSDFFG
jgi:hypothetical protein